MVKIEQLIFAFFKKGRQYSKEKTVIAKMEGMVYSSMQKSNPYFDLIQIDCSKKLGVYLLPSANSNFAQDSGKLN